MVQLVACTVHMQLSTKLFFSIVSHMRFVPTTLTQHIIRSHRPLETFPLYLDASLAVKTPTTSMLPQIASTHLSYSSNFFSLKYSQTSAIICPTETPIGSSSVSKQHSQTQVHRFTALQSLVSAPLQQIWSSLSRGSASLTSTNNSSVT